MKDLSSPRSLAEALAALEQSPDLTPIAGCTDLMVRDAGECREFSGVLDLTRIPELRGIRVRDDFVEIGATTTFSEIRGDDVIASEYPALASAAGMIGGWQIQNRATIGGNIVNASPAGDSLPVLQALEARVVVAGRSGERQVPMTGFYRAYRQTVLETGELVARIRLPRSVRGERQLFRKLGTRRAQAISKVVVALVGRVEDEAIVDYRLAAGSVAPTPIRLTAVEKEMVGAQAARERADAAGRIASESVTPIDDVRSSAEYRRYALEKVVRRLTLQLLDSPR